MNITAILPVSRANYLDRVIESLLAQTVQPKNLLVVYDGEENDYLSVRNKIVGLSFDSVLCIQSNNSRIAHTIPERRQHIISIHKQFQELIGDSDWIFSIEDDGILPDNALERLIDLVTSKQDVGMATGVELGRWGVPYVGAWRADDVVEPKNIQSLLYKDGGIEEIDACGLYCALIRSSFYKSHNFSSENGLGPDVNLGLYLRTQGLKNYIDWGIPVTHLTESLGTEIEIPASSKSLVVRLRHLTRDIWEAYR